MPAARPLKGSAKLLRACMEDLADIAFDGRTVVAVFDADRVRDLLGLAAEASREEVRVTIRQRCGEPDNLAVFLLDDNAETVVRQLGDCNDELDPDLVRKALQKDLEARDVLFGKASAAGMQRLRECVLGANESLARIVTDVCDLLRPVLTAAEQG